MAGLFDPIDINGFELKNRMVMAPMATNMATPEGRITDRHVKHYTARAEGGVGLIILEHTYVAVEGKLARNQTGLYDDGLVSDLKRLVDAIHEAGSKVIIQLTHAGARTTKETTGSQPLGPSPIRLPDGVETPRIASIPEIKKIVTAFIEGSRRAIEAGCDGIELHGAHGFLLNQFVSPLTNHRNDEYGGTTENRARFAAEIIRGVKNILGGKPVFYRFGADDMVSGGLTHQEGQEVASILEHAGVSVLDISGGLGVGDSYGFSEQGFFVPLAERIKRVVKVPVIGVGNITEPEFADRIIRENRVDLVAIGRKLLSDPDFPHKAAIQLGIDTKP
jgi:NADPH2 dehydrogenase